MTDASSKNLDIGNLSQGYWTPNINRITFFVRATQWRNLASKTYQCSASWGKISNCGIHWNLSIHPLSLSFMEKDCCRSRYYCTAYSYNLRYVSKFLLLGWQIWLCRWTRGKDQTYVLVLPKEICKAWVFSYFDNSRAWSAADVSPIFWSSRANCTWTVNFPLLNWKPCLTLLTKWHYQC